MTKAKFYELYQDYVCGVALRVARELFAILPLNTAFITTKTMLLNKKRKYGLKNKIIIYS